MACSAHPVNVDDGESLQRKGHNGCGAVKRVTRPYALRVGCLLAPGLPHASCRTEHAIPALKDLAAAVLASRCFNPATCSNASALAHRAVLILRPVGDALPAKQALAGGTAHDKLPLACERE